MIPTLDILLFPPIMELVIWINNFLSTAPIVNLSITHEHMHVERQSGEKSEATETPRAAVTLLNGDRHSYRYKASVFLQIKAGM